jgi:hypothetical protein
MQISELFSKVDSGNYGRGSKTGLRGLLRSSFDELLAVQEGLWTPRSDFIMHALKNEDVRDHVKGLGSKMDGDKLIHRIHTTLTGWVKDKKLDTKGERGSVEIDCS